MRARLIIVAACLPLVLGLNLRSKKGPLDTPSTTGYEPEDLLCKLGKKTQSWCVDWLKCIKGKSAGQAEKVRDAWGPADCEEYCGVHPVTSPLEGQSLVQKKANLTANSAAVAALFGKKAGMSTKDCMGSCKNFQDSLVKCVGTIMFEPGQLAVMGPDKSATPTPEHCKGKKTPCLPDLPIRYQKCHSMHTKKMLQGKDYDVDACEVIMSDYDDCKDCPALNEAGGTAYATFVGGCMDQLNSYWQATHPSAGVHALPGASGCTVHD